MPAKNRQKIYLEDSYYHIYNRGVEKRLIFQNPQDYQIFITYLQQYLVDKDEQRLSDILISKLSSLQEKTHARSLLRLNNFADSLKLVAFCLMRNHFHLLVKQTEKTTIDKFMNSLSTRYSMYFNKKYSRVGPLFQGVYKAVQILDDEQLLYVSRYIHRNPFVEGQAFNKLGEYPYSSYRHYVGRAKLAFIQNEGVLSYFQQSKRVIQHYQSFVEDRQFDNEESIQVSQLAE